MSKIRGVAFLFGEKTMTNLKDSFPKKIHTIIKVDLDDLKKLDDLVDKANDEAELKTKVETNPRKRAK